MNVGRNVQLFLLIRVEVNSEVAKWDIGSGEKRKQRKIN